MLKIVHTSDWHLGATHGVLARPLAPLIAEIRKPFEHARSFGYRHVVVAGDISDTSQLPPDCLKFMLWLFRKYDGVLDIHLLMGNHDFDTDKTTSMDVLKEASLAFETIHVYDTPTQVKLDGVWVNFLPHPHEERLDPPEDLACLNVAHFSPVGSLNDNGTPVKRGVLLRDDGDFWLMGHVHTQQYGSNWLMCGSPWQVRFGENDDKGFCTYDVSYDANGDVAVQDSFVPTHPKLRRETVTIDDPAQFEELSEDPLVLYDLRIADDVVVPHQQLARMPNVLKRSGGVTTSGGKRKQMTTSAAELASLLDDDTLMEAILREKLDGRELARALDVNRALTDKVTSKLRANAARAASLAEAAE